MTDHKNDSSARSITDELMFLKGAGILLFFFSLIVFVFIIYLYLNRSLPDPYHWQRHTPMSDFLFPAFFILFDFCLLASSVFLSILHSRLIKTIADQQFNKDSDKQNHERSIAIRAASFDHEIHMQFLKDILKTDSEHNEEKKIQHIEEYKKGIQEEVEKIKKLYDLLSPLTAQKNKPHV